MSDKFQALVTVEMCMNKSIKAIHRVVHCLRDNHIVENTLPLQIDFDDGTVVAFDAALDAESLSVTTEVWRDILNGRTDADAVAYAEQYGRWELVDVSDTERFSAFIGHPIHTVVPIALCLPDLVMDNPPLAGVQLHISDKTLIVVAMWEELHVYFSDKDETLKELPIKIVLD